MLVAGELLAAESRDARLRQTGSNWLSGIADRYPDRAADAIYRIAMSHYRQGDLVNAETMLLKATTLAPTAPQPTNALAWLYGQDRDRPREALGLIERFTQAGGTANAEMLDTHAAILLKLGRIDEARQKATECLNAAGQTPTLTAANYRMGLALLEQGDRDAAITYVRHALHLDEQLGGLTPTERSEARRILMP
jgi:Flp pilus assembly protein TadD